MLLSEGELEAFMDSSEHGLDGDALEGHWKQVVASLQQQQQQEHSIYQQQQEQQHAQQQLLEPAGDKQGPHNLTKAISPQGDAGPFAVEGLSAVLGTPAAAAAAAAAVTAAPQQQRTGNTAAAVGAVAGAAAGGAAAGEVAGAAAAAAAAAGGAAAGGSAEAAGGREMMHRRKAADSGGDGATVSGAALEEGEESEEEANWMELFRWVESRRNDLASSLEKPRAQHTGSFGHTCCKPSPACCFSWQIFILHLKLCPECLRNCSPITLNCLFCDEVDSCTAFGQCGACSK